MPLTVAPEPITPRFTCRAGLAEARTRRGGGSRRGQVKAAVMDLPAEVHLPGRGGEAARQWRTCCLQLTEFHPFSGEGRSSLAGS